LGIGDYQEAPFINHASSASNEATDADALTRSIPSDGSSEVDNLQASSEHASDDGLTMMATAASACDAAVFLPPATTATNQTVDSVFVQTVNTSAPQLTVGQQESLSCSMPLSS
jgi:hypothetical protein